MKITRTDHHRHPYTIQIDRCDLALYRRHKWQRHVKGLIRYAGPCKGSGSVLLHREILKLKPDEYALHLNGDKFDCRRKNLRVISRQEQRQMQKKPFIRTVEKGRPNGLCFHTAIKRKPNGKQYAYRMVMAHFCYRYQQHCKRWSIATLGLEEAVRRALAWRVGMIREHGLTPNPQLVDMLERATRMARAGGGFEEIYGGNAEYEHSVVIGSESSFQVRGFDYGQAA